MKYESISIVSNDNDKVEVVQSRSIRIDDEFYMVPSFGYAGVDLGRVAVLAIGETDDLYAHPDLGTKVASDIGEFMELDLQAYEEFTEEYTNRQEVLSQGLWVVYKYLKTDDIEEYVYVFPIEEFLDHSVRMF